MQDIGKLYERTNLYENILCISLLVILVFVVIYVFFGMIEEIINIKLF